MGGKHRPTNLRKLTLPLPHDPGAEAQMDFGGVRVRPWVSALSIQSRSWSAAWSCVGNGSTASSTRDAIEDHQGLGPSPDELADITDKIR